MTTPAWWAAVTEAPGRAASAVGSAVGSRLGDVDTAIRQVAGDYRYGGAPTASPVGGVTGLLPQIREAAGQHGLDPSLLAGVVDFESGGNPGAINKSSGATGLGQVMPREAGFPDRPTRQQLLDPGTNLDWAARILKGGLDRYGTEDKALAAYLGAIDSRGNITGAVDANGTGGNRYIQTVRARQQRYTGQAPAAAPAVSPVVKAAAAAPEQPAWWASVSDGQPASGAAPASQGRGAAPNAPATADPKEQARPGQTPQWLQLAESQLGKPYIWGSAGGRSNFNLGAPGYDCSGFVAQVYKNAFGVDIPAFTGSAYPTTKAVSQQEAQPGDLVFWNMDTPDPRRQHIAIYIGGGKVIQSGGAGDGVNIAPVTQIPRAEFRRLPAAYAHYGGGTAEPGRQLPATAPTQPQSYQLQGADAPAWWASVA